MARGSSSPLSASSRAFFSSSALSYRFGQPLRRIQYAVSSLRFASTARAAPKPFPERLLVYHAGTPRTTFLACLKVTTLFGLAFFTFLVAPAYVAAGKPWWQVVGVAVCGLVPFAVVAYTSSPFVVFVHLRLPTYARHPDRDLLRRFVRSAPAATLLDVTTMNLVGRPRLTTVAVGDLAPAHERLRIVNLVRKGQPSAPSTVTTMLRFPWVRLPPLMRFGAPLTGNSRGTREGWAWEELLALIGRRARAPAEKEGLGAKP
ncbi:hypothetical protein SPI_03884 [Niveomyces insectorum RCEF 264]|uniref:Uncharacterized protein n=1 Tax=Niveomyces insectorum RCEF 264 TaxID=1081102 RepID=A0A167WFF1_9HYPO|nr:hypothetical protein SPI_03884 [Niveomyces insectorum RCEF 264]